MKVTLRKVTKTPLDFDIKSDEITFKGYLEYHNGRLIFLKANLGGFLTKPCDICAEELKLPIDEKVNFFVSDGIYEDDNDIEFDVVESLNGIVDMDELLCSEIELIKSDYHYCKNCI